MLCSSVVCSFGFSIEVRTIILMNSYRCPWLQNHTCEPRIVYHLSLSLQIYYLYLLIVVKSYIYLSLINTQLYPTSKDDFPIQTTVMSTTKIPWFSPRNSWLRRTSDVHWAVVLSRCPSGIDHPQRWFHHLGWFDVNMLRTKHINKQGDIYIYIYLSLHVMQKSRKT